MYWILRKIFDASTLKKIAAGTFNVYKCIVNNLQAELFII